MLGGEASLAVDEDQRIAETRPVVFHVLLVGLVIPFPEKATAFVATGAETQSETGIHY